MTGVWSCLIRVLPIFSLHAFSTSRSNCVLIYGDVHQCTDCSHRLMASFISVMMHLDLKNVLLKNK